MRLVYNSETLPQCSYVFVFGEGPFQLRLDLKWDVIKLHQYLFDWLLKIGNIKFVQSIFRILDQGVVVRLDLVDNQPP